MKKASFTVESPCIMSLLTMEKVDKCPSTPEEFMLATMNKRCSELKDAQNCVEDPEKFKYQCLLNEEKNGFVEFCAPEWKLNGYCGFFDTTYGQIHNDVNKDCTTFQVNPCPSSFPSSDSYKYQGCLKIDGNVTNTQEETRSTNPNSTTSYYSNTMVDTDNPIPSADNNLYYLLLLLLLLLIGFAICIWYRKSRKPIDSTQRSLLLCCLTKINLDNDLPPRERKDEPAPHENLKDENTCDSTQRSPLLGLTKNVKDKELPAREREGEPAPHENLEDENTCDSTQRSPLLGLTKNVKDKELPAREREGEPAPHENLEDENTCDSTQRSPLLGLTKNVKDKELPAREREGEPAPHENLEDENTCDSTQRSPLLGLTKNVKDKELPAREREGEPAPHENLEDENTCDSTQRSPLLGLTKNVKDKELPAREREGEPAPHENLEDENTCDSTQRSPLLGLTKNVKDKELPAREREGEPAPHENLEDIKQQFQEPAMFNESNFEELETEPHDQGFEKDTEESSEKSDKKKNQSMGQETLETTENQECGDHEASGATCKAEETHSRDTVETATSTDIDLLKPADKEYLMETLSIFIGKVVNSLGRDKRTDAISNEFDGQFWNYHQEREIKEIRQKIHNLEQRQEEVDQLKEKIKNLENSVIAIKASKNEECHQLKTELRERDNLLTKQNTEIEQLKAAVKEKQKEIDQLKEELKERCESDSKKRKQKKGYLFKQ
uniref:Early endosome antigen 1-like isoform X3 n=1 Tax=Crassostrea virginica TaxID=6565 RepID=A0A8B8AWM3_CRAVI|nr:early endosome antigen 1-like isoform X3 [Crassostrea virginica]